GARARGRPGGAWRSAATDPAVGVLGGKAFVVGGTPIAHTQVFDPNTGTWTQGPPITDAPTGVDNTAGTVLGLTFHLIGGFNGTGGIPTHWPLHARTLGGLSSAAFLPLIVDGNGSVDGVTNERTALVLDNGASGSPLNVSCYLYGTDGKVMAKNIIAVGPNELKTVSDIIRNLTGTKTVQ